VIDALLVVVPHRTHAGWTREKRNKPNETSKVKRGEKRLYLRAVPLVVVAGTELALSALGVVGAVVIVLALLALVRRRRRKEEKRREMKSE
jgi:Flp pilus assembly protein TadB